MKDSPQTISSDDAAEIVLLSQSKFQWKTQREIDRVEDLFDDELVFVHINGHVSSKAEWIREMRSGRFIYRRIDVMNAHAEVHGQTAVLAGRAIFEVSMRGFAATYDIGYTETYRRKGGVWKLVELRTKTY